MKRQILAVSILLVATQLFGQESRFWVGGSGKWADNSHWATVSGGEPGATVPESGTSVVFDANSFSGAKNTVTLSDEVVIGSLTATDAEFVFSGKKDLTVGGSVSVDSKVDFGKLRGALVLSAEGDQTLNLPATLDGDIVFNGGNWTLTSDLATEGNITLNAGSLNTAGHSVTCSVFTATENAEELDIRNSSMVTDKWFTNAAENMTVKAAGAIVYVAKNIITDFFYADGHEYEMIQTKSAAKEGITFTAEIASTDSVKCPGNASSDNENDFKAKVTATLTGATGTYSIGVLEIDSSDPDVFNETGYSKKISLPVGSYTVGYYKGHSTPYKLLGGRTVNVKAPKDFTGGIAVAKDANCYGGDVILKSGVGGGTEPYAYIEWEEGNHVPVNTEFTAHSDNNIYLAVTDKHGCRYEPDPFRYYLDDEDNSYKTGPAKIEIADITKDPACEEESNGTLKIKAKGGNKENSSYTYTLSGPASATDTKGKNVYAELESLKKGVYTLKINDDKGCESEDISVPLDDVKKPTINIGADQYICEDESNPAINGVTITGDYTSVKWTSDNVAVSLPTGQDVVLNSNLTIITSGSSSLTLVAKNGSCETDPATKNVEVISLPNPIIKTETGNVCGLVVDIEAVPGIPGNDANLIAEVDEANSDGAKASGSSGLKLKVTKAGSYTVFVKEKKTEGGCDCYGTSSTITLTFYDKPVFEDKKFDAPTSVCGAGVLSSIKVNTKNATAFKWSLEKGADTSFGPDDEATTKYTTQVADVTTNKEVKLKVVASNVGCTGEDAISDTYTFPVYAKPEPAINKTKYTTCNDTIELEGKITAGNTDVTWEPSDKANVKIIDSKIDNVDKTKVTAKAVLVAGAEHKTYTITLNEKGQGDCGTIKSTAADLEFKGKPSITMVEHDYKFCDGPMTYTAKYTNAENATYIHWGESSEFAIAPPVFGDTTATYTFTKQGLTELKKVTIYVYAEDPSCASTPAVDSVVVKVLPIPNITINKDTAVCGTTYKVPTYVPSVKGDDKIIPTYSWGKSEGENNADFDVKTGIFKPKNMGDNDSVICRLNLTEKIDACSASKDANVKFYAKPVVEKLKSCPDTLCDEEVLKIDLTKIFKAEHAKSLVWYSSDIEFTPDNTNVYVASDDDKDQGYVKLTLLANGYGCCDDAEKTVMIYIKKPVTPTITDGEFDVCKNDEVTYKTQPGMSDYVWKVDGVTVGTDSVLNYKWAKDPKKYPITVSYSNGCATKTSLPDSVVVHGMPAIPPVFDTTCTETPWNFDATITGNYTYSWKTHLDKFQTPASQPDITFVSEEAGDFPLVCLITDIDYGCPAYDTVNVHVVQAPVIKVNTITPVCDKADFVNNYESGKYYVEVENNDDCTYLWEIVSGTGDFESGETDLAMVYKPTPADREAGEVKFKFSVTKNHCSTVSDTITVKLLQPMNAGIGGVAPFKIASTTEINVTIKGSYKGGYADGLGFYLVAPDGTELKLYQQDRAKSKKWTVSPGDFNITFSTKSDKVLNLTDFAKGATIIDTFNISNWNIINGMNPAEGGWAVKVGGSFTKAGKLMHAIITFSDHEKNDSSKPIKKVRFDSKEISPALTIRNGSRAKYISPIGLHVECYGDSIQVVSKPLRDGDSDTHSYTFEWATSSDFSSASVIAKTVGKSVDTLKLAAGKYFISITDEYGCSVMDSFEISTPEKITIGQVRNDTIACYGDTIGVLEVNVTNLGAVQSNYSFSWAKKGSAEELSSLAKIENLAAGDYVVTVTNNEDGCTVDSTLTVVQPDAPLTVEIIADSVKPASCGGDPNGQVMFIANGGTRNYSLFADGLQKDSDKADTLAATGLAGKKVEFKIKDARGCELDTAVSVAPDTLSLEYAITKEIKCPDDSATVKVTVKNAKPSDAFTYKWDGGEETSASTMKLVAGVHKVEVAPFGTTCFTELPITVKGARLITNKITYSDSIKCYGDETASFYAKADSNGVVSGNYTYLWKDDFGHTWNDTAVTNVGVGKYYLTILTDDGCEIYDTVEVKGPASPLKFVHNNIRQTVWADCGEENGAVQAEAIGGVAKASGYDFVWTLQSDETKKKTGATVTTIGAGLYNLTVTDSLGCSVDTSFNVKDNGKVDFNYALVQSVTCKDRDDAEVAISQVMENGVAATSFKIEWNNLVAYSKNDTTITNVGDSTIIKITTNKGCSGDTLIRAIGNNTLRFVVKNIENQPDVTGNGSGWIKAQIAGGIGGYTYDWSVEPGEPEGNVIAEGDIAKTDSTTTLKNRQEGKYKLTVADEEGCGIDTVIEVKYSPVDVIVTVDSVKCQGTNGGTVTLKGFGGFAGEPYIYMWNKLDADPLLAEYDTTNVLVKSGLYAGNYRCKIWQIDSTWVRMCDTVIRIGEPNIALRIPNDSIVIDSTYCYATTGAITIKVPADSAAAFDNFNGYWPLTFTVKKGDDEIIPKNLETGWYTVVAQDALGCEFKKDVVVGDKSQFKVSSSVKTALRCYDYTNGVIEAQATIKEGEISSYEWTKWLDRNDNELPELKVVSNDSSATGLGAGTYIVDVKVVVNTKECHKFDTVKLAEPDSIWFKVSNTIPNTCFTKADGEVRIDSLRGGCNVDDRKYKYFTFTSDTNSIYDNNGDLVKVFRDTTSVDSSYVLSNRLLAGNYTVVVRDEGFCPSYPFAFTVSSLPRVSFAVSNIEPNSCYNSNDGEVKLENLQGGVEKYNFFEVLDVNKNVLFSDSMMVASKADSIGTDTTAIFAPGLTVGKYLVRVADTSDCFSEYDTLQVFTKRPRIVLDTIIENVLPECGMFKKDGSVSNEGVVTAFASKLMTPDVKTMGADLKLFFKVDDGEFKADSVLTKLTAGKHNITISYADTLCADTVYAFNLGAKSNLVADAHFIGTPKAIFTCPDKELTAYVESGENGGPFSYKFYTLSDEEAEKLLPVEPAPEPAKEEKPVENNTAVDDSTNTADTANAVAYRYNRGIYFRADSVPAVDTTGNPAVTDTVPVLLPVYDHQTIRGRMVSVLASGSREDGSVKVSGDTWRAYADDIKPYGYETFYYFEITNDQCISVDSIKATALRPVEDLQIIVDMEDVTSDELLIDGEYQVPEGGLLTLTANQLEFEFSDNIFAYAENGWLWQSAPADNNESSSSGLFIGRIETTSPSMNENPLVAQGYGRFIAKVWDSVRFELSDYSEGVYRISDTTLTCSYYDTVVVNAESTIKPRKVFTPNGDGHNDTWKIAGMASYDKATIYVFNRWGGRVWQYSGTGREYDTKEWDGRNEKNKPVPSGTYYYVIQCSDGVLGGKKVTGPVTIIR